VTVAETSARPFMMTSWARPAARTTSTTRSHAHRSPRWSSTTPTMPRSVRSPSRIAKYCAVAPKAAEATTTQRNV